MKKKFLSTIAIAVVTSMLIEIGVSATSEIGYFDVDNNEIVTFDLSTGNSTKKLTIEAEKEADKFSINTLEENCESVQNRESLISDNIRENDNVMLFSNEESNDVEEHTKIQKSQSVIILKRFQIRIL